MGARDQANSPYAFYFGKIGWDYQGAETGKTWQRQSAMERVGDAWVPAWTGMSFTVIMSDFVFYNTWSQTFLATTHDSGSGTAVPGGSLTGDNYGWKYQIGEVANGNFASADGSVTHHSFEIDSITLGTMTAFRSSTGGSSYWVPTSLGNCAGQNASTTLILLLSLRAAASFRRIFF